MITEAERTWLSELYEYNRKKFLSTDLPSHDHNHHLRVWYFVKELLTELENAGNVIPSAIPEKMIFASFFHDIGLTETLNEEHGKVSRRICLDFIKQNNISFSGGDDDLLDSIEHHDDKSYKLSITKNSGPLELYTMLTVCDDLDAFGAIGVFRYLEIYLLRNISFENLPGKVLQNITSRFDNFSMIYSFLKKFTIRHTGRYEYTRNFYEDLSECLNNLTESNDIDTGPVEAINWLMENYVTRKFPGIKIQLPEPEKKNSHYRKDFINTFLEEINASKPTDKK